MTEQDVTPLPNVAQMYRQGLRFAALATEGLDSGPVSAGIVDTTVAYAMAAQASFAGVQAAAFATMVMEAATDLDEDVDEADSVESTVLGRWREVFELSGGR